MENSGSNITARITERQMRLWNVLHSSEQSHFQHRSPHNQAGCGLRPVNAESGRSADGIALFWKLKRAHWMERLL